MEKMRILAIDDNTVNLATLEQELKSKYEVIPMISGRRAIKYLYREQVDLILLDVMLPTMDGFTVLRRLRAEGNATPVLMLTARSELGDRVEGLDCGADYYLTKPFEPKELMPSIRAQTRQKPKLRTHKNL